MRWGALILLMVAVARAEEFPGLTVELVAHRYAYTEGPAWSTEGFLVFSDVPSNRMWKITPGQGVAIYREASNGAIGNAWDEHGRLYTCEQRTRRVVRTDKKGKIETIASEWKGKRLNSPNDIVVSKSGHVYFTDPAFGLYADTRELPNYGVYHVTPKGEVQLIAQPAGRPNGIALSHDEKLLYVVNSDERNVRVYDIEKSGAVSNERVLISKIDGVPDGIRTDEKGNVFLACSGLAIYSPDGKLLRLVQMSEKPSNLAWGDADGKSLYVTARTSVFRVRFDGGRNKGETEN